MSDTTDLLFDDELAIEPVILHGERITLARMTMSDAERVTALCQAPDISVWTTVPANYTVDVAKAWIATHISDCWGKGEPQWGIYLADELCGSFSLFRAGENAYEVGYWLGEHYRGNGYVSEAINTAADWAFNELGATRIVWRSLVGNWASWKSAWNAGFTREGIQRGVVHHGRPATDYWAASLVKGDPREPRTPWDGPSALAAQGESLDPSQPGKLVEQFHATYAMPNRLIMAEEPTVDIDRIDMRMGLIGEEFAELMGAVYGPAARAHIEEAFAHASTLDDKKRDVVESADALADLIYVIYGMAIECGINLDKVLAEVQASNLSKLMPDGSVKLREDGKVLKGPNFFEPNVARALGMDHS